VSKPTFVRRWGAGARAERGTPPIMMDPRFLSSVTVATAGVGVGALSWMMAGVALGGMATVGRAGKSLYESLYVFCCLIQSLSSILSTAVSTPVVLHGRLSREALLMGASIRSLSLASSTSMTW
jgi:hypothetical protein